MVEPDQGWDLIGQRCCGFCLHPIESSATWTYADPWAWGGGGCSPALFLFSLGGGGGGGFNIFLIGIS